MLSERIIEFVEEMKKLNAVGGIKTPQKNYAALLQEVGKAPLTLSSESQEDRVACYRVNRGSDLSQFDAPCILLIIEEEYDEHKEWNLALKAKVAYFLNVE